MASPHFRLELVRIDDQPKDPAPGEKSATHVPLTAATIERVPQAPAAIELAPMSPAEIELGQSDATPADATVPENASDRFLKEATYHYSKGHLDQALWNRALAQAHGDKEATVGIYLAARATALRVFDRERRMRKHAREHARAAHGVHRQIDEAAKPVSFQSESFLRSAFAKYRVAIVAGAALMLLALGAWLVYFIFFQKAPATAARSAPASVAVKPQVPKPAVVAPAGQGARAELMKKIDELRDAENWNVLVFYLAEWTRQEPANPDAWDQLRAIYVRLKQYDDALVAAKKASDLPPANARLWQHLGAGYADVGDTDKALVAYQQAVTRDENDAESLTQIAMLMARQGRVQEAKVAFDRALSVSPGYPTAVCMRSGIAPLSTAPTDAYATAKQIRAIDAQCRGVSEPVVQAAPAAPAAPTP